jgi:hypothetical protein
MIVSYAEYTSAPRHRMSLRVKVPFPFPSLNLPNNKLERFSLQAPFSLVCTSEYGQYQTVESS